MTKLGFEYSGGERYEKSRPIRLTSNGSPVFGMRCSADDAKELLVQLTAAIKEAESRGRCVCSEYATRTHPDCRAH